MSSSEKKKRIMLPKISTYCLAWWIIPSAFKQPRLNAGSYLQRNLFALKIAVYDKKRKDKALSLAILVSVS